MSRQDCQSSLAFYTERRKASSTNHAIFRYLRQDILNISAKFAFDIRLSPAKFFLGFLEHQTIYLLSRSASGSSFRCVSLGQGGGGGGGGVETKFYKLGVSSAVHSPQNEDVQCPVRHFEASHDAISRKTGRHQPCPRKEMASLWRER